MTRTLLTFVALCAMFACSALAGEMTGYVSDSKCGAAHQDGSAKSVACVKACIKNGQEPVLVVDGKVMSIKNAAKVPADLYGLKVTVDGEMSGDAVTINSIKKAT